MAPNFQSSFIPKEPITSDVFQKKKTGLLGVVAILLFILAIAGSLGGFFYKRMLQSEVLQLETKVSEAEKNIDRKTIGEMSQFNKKLSLVKAIISEHEVLSNFLSTLSASAVKDLYFTGMSFNRVANNNLVVNMQGKARGYSTIALQENVFSKNPNFKSASFSNLSIAEGGWIVFDLAVSVDPKLFVYSPAVKEVGQTVSTAGSTKQNDIEVDLKALEDDLKINYEEL